MTHTPGPWTAIPPINEPGHYLQTWGVTAESDPEAVIASVNGLPDEDIDFSVVEADARLIAAAPDILEALEQMLRTPMPFYRPNAGNYAQKRAEYEAVLERARAAIAKAKGE